MNGEGTRMTADDCEQTIGKLFMKLVSALRVYVNHSDNSFRQKFTLQHEVGCSLDISFKNMFKFRSKNYNWLYGKCHSTHYWNI